MSEPLLELSEIRRSFRHGLLSPVHDRVLAGISLRIQPGETVGLVGRSGCGKSTLVRVAMGLLGRDAGRLRVCGTEIPNRPPRSRRAWRQVQVLFQDPAAHLDPWRTVRQLLLLSARLHRPDEDASRLVAEALEQIGLSHRADSPAQALSGGEKRRVGIVRVRLARPALILADEPTAGLDAAIKYEILSLLIESPERPAVLFVSHDLPLVASSCDRVLVMCEGRIAEELGPRSLCEGGSHPETRALVAASPLARRPPGPVEGRP